MDNSRDVLIVEDDECTSALMKVVVDHFGFRPTMCSDGATALHHLRTTGTGILLLDLLLPHMNGFEVLRELKCTQPGMLRRTIVLTAATNRTVADCAELAEVWMALRKPFELTEFGEALQACAAALAADRVRPESSGRTSRAGSQQERDTPP